MTDAAEERDRDQPWAAGDRHPLPLVGIGLFLGPGNGVAFTVIGLVFLQHRRGCSDDADSRADHALRVNMRRTRSACRGVSLHSGR